MLSACPSFEPTWRESAQDAERYPDEDPIYYVLLGDFARHLLALEQAGATGEFPSVFEFVERWHTEGDDYVKEAATIGLLEGIQNSASDRGFGTGVFEPWLRPETKR